MINNLELYYILNGTEISLQNVKNNLFLTLESSISPDEINTKYSFKVSGVHPYLLNNDFESEINLKSKFRIVLYSMPDYASNKERSIIKYNDQVALMLNNNIFIVATNDGNLKLEKLKNEGNLISKNLPANARFTIIQPNSKIVENKPLLYDDIIILKTNFGGNISLNKNSIDETGINVNYNLQNEENKWKIIKVNIPLIPSWHNKRKYLNNNINSYLYNMEQNYNTKLNSTSRKNNNTNKLSDLTSTEQDKELVNDLLLVMIGLEGKYIKRIINTNSFKDFKVGFEVEPYLDNPTCDHPLLSLSNLIIPMGYYYNSISYYINIGSKPESGLISKSFCDGLNKVLREYLLFVNQIEEYKIYSNINLQQLWWICQPSLKLLECIYILCQKCFMVKGGALINIIYSFFIHENDSKIKSIYKFLLSKSFNPFFDMLNLWICHGYLENEHNYQEFMIFSPKSFIQEKLGEYYQDLFWEIKFILSKENIPTFLDNISSKILFIGKSFNIIKESKKNIKCPFEKEFEEFKDIIINDTNEDDDIKNVFKNNNEDDNKVKNKSRQMIFETERIIEFENLINKIYNWINITLKNLLFNEKDLILMMSLFKKFMLMEAGDYYNDFIESNMKLFNKSLNAIIEENKEDNIIKIPIYKKEGIKMFKYFIYNLNIEDLKLYLVKYNQIISSNGNDIMLILSQLEKLDYIFNDKRDKIPKQSIKAIECIDIVPEINWPLNLIFSKKI